MTCSMKASPALSETLRIRHNRSHYHDATGILVSDFLSPLYKLWLCESVRLREEQTGLLEDSEACRKARTAQCSLAERLMLRGLFLAKRDGLEIALQHWLQGAKLA